MEAQARNRRWYEFLCTKRDELQARLRQQGYSRRSQVDGQPAEVDGNAANPLTETSAQSPESSNRWGVAMGEGNLESAASMETVQVPEMDAPGPVAPIWWGERDQNPL
jgi:hypothetical protein